MYYDADRRSVRSIFDNFPILQAHAEARKARCPDCDAPLVAKRPAHAIWHWAHKADRPEGCQAGGESQFHLRTKDALLASGFDLEVKCGEFRFDAMSRDHDFVVVEVVNSLSLKYYDKATALAPLGVRQLWILNSDEAWSNATWEPCRKPGWADLVAHLRSVGATVWWIGATIYEDRGCADTYNYPDLLASLYYAHEENEDITLDYIRANLDVMISRHRMQQAANAMMAEARDLTAALARS